MYFNEHLTQYIKTLFEAKKYKFTKKLQFLWGNGAKMFERELADAVVGRISKVADLTAYYGPLTTPGHHPSERRAGSTARLQRRPTETWDSDEHVYFVQK